jgi:hypothetical protein
MPRESNRSRANCREGNLGPSKVGVGTTRVPLCNRKGLGLLVAIVTALVWFADAGPLKEDARLRLVPVGWLGSEPEGRSPQEFRHTWGLRRLRRLDPSHTSCASRVLSALTGQSETGKKASRPENRLRGTPMLRQSDVALLADR